MTILQTDSTISSIRGWGCYYMSLLSIWDKADLTLPEIEAAWQACVKLGYILDNNLLTTLPGWYRSFVASPLGVFRSFDLLRGFKTAAAEMYRGPIRDTGDGERTIIEYKTKHGSHFTSGRIEKGAVVVTYNPYPRIKLGDIRTVRHWRLD